MTDLFVSPRRAPRARRPLLLVAAPAPRVVPDAGDSPPGPDVSDVTTGELIESTWGISVAADLAELWERKVEAADLSGHITVPTDAHDASAISFVPTGNIAAVNAQTAIAEVATDAATALAAHEADTTGVHGIADAALLETTTGAQAKVDTHVNDTTAAHTAAAIAVVPGAGIVSTDVQGALVELQAEIGAGGGGGLDAEGAVDATAAALAAGTHTNVTVTYNDAANAISLAAAAGGSTLLVGAGVPDVGVGAVGDFYIDTTGDDIYGPKSAASFGAAQIPTIASTPDNEGSSVHEGGMKWRFLKAGRVTGIRYRRRSVSSPLLYFKAWRDSDQVKVAEVTDNRSTTGQYTVAFPTPVVVSADSTWTFTIATNPEAGVPRNTTTQVVTGTTDVQFIEPRQGDAVDTYPNTTFSFTMYYAEPVFEPGSSPWPAALETSSVVPAPLAQTIETAAGTTYAVVAGDSGKLKSLSGTATVTLPSGGLAAGERVDFVCVGGPATFALGSGATWAVNPTPSAVARAIGSFVTAIKMGATTWALTGDLA